jgi:hypothetical protein
VKRSTRSSYPYITRRSSPRSSFLARWTNHVRKTWFVRLACPQTCWTPLASPFSQVYSNTCSSRNRRSGGAPFQGANGPTTPRGCVGHTTSSNCSGRPLQAIRPRASVRASCDFAGCDKRAVNRGLCQAHAKQRQKGQPLRPLRPFYGTKGPCRFDGCAKPRVGGGSCAGHAAQYYGGRPLAPLWKPKVGRDFPGCTKRHFALGFCQGHWRQLREKRPLTPLRGKSGRIINRGIRPYLRTPPS